LAWSNRGYQYGGDGTVGQIQLVGVCMEIKGIYTDQKHKLTSKKTNKNYKNIYILKEAFNGVLLL